MRRSTVAALALAALLTAPAASFAAVSPLRAVRSALASESPHVVRIPAIYPATKITFDPPLWRKPRSVPTIRRSRRG